MQVLWNGHKFCYFLSLIHYDFACHETLYNEMTSEIRTSKIRRKITEMRNTNFSYVTDSSKFY